MLVNHTRTIRFYERAFMINDVRTTSQHKMYTYVYTRHLHDRARARTKHISQLSRSSTTHFIHYCKCVSSGYYCENKVNEKIFYPHRHPQMPTFEKHIWYIQAYRREMCVPPETDSYVPYERAHEHFVLLLLLLLLLGEYKTTYLLLLLDFRICVCECKSCYA